MSDILAIFKGQTGTVRSIGAHLDARKTILFVQWQPPRELCNVLRSFKQRNAALLLQRMPLAESAQKRLRTHPFVTSTTAEMLSGKNRRRFRRGISVWSGGVLFFVNRFRAEIFRVCSSVCGIILYVCVYVIRKAFNVERLVRGIEFLWHLQRISIVSISNVSLIPFFLYETRN